jgi:hypothetical protein
MAQTFNSPAPAPAPATAASFDMGTGGLSVNFPGAPAPSTGSVADLALTGSLTNYMNLGMDGGFAPSKTPGYPNTWQSLNMESWPQLGGEMVQVASGDNLPSVQAWNLKDDKGQLFEVVYTNSAGTSNVLYKNSTTKPEHVVSLTPGGSKVIGDPDQTAAAPGPATEGETPLWVKVSSCCSSLVYCAGIVFLSSMLVPKK